jgi:hypothetical protein
MVSYSPEIAERICLRLAAGESLRKICQGSEFPGRDTVLGWVFKNPEFAEMYKTARAIQVQGYADEVLDIADDSSGDVNEDGTVNHANVQRARLMVDSRKWVLAKMLPKQFGDKVSQEVSGPDGQPLIPVDDEIKEKLARWIVFHSTKPSEEI